jgi:hypothetical protein
MDKRSRMREGCRDTIFGVCSGTYPYFQKEDIRYD